MTFSKRVFFLLPVALLAGCPQPINHTIYNASDKPIEVVSQSGLVVRIFPRQSGRIPNSGNDLDRTQDGFKKIRIRYDRAESCSLTPFLGDPIVTTKPALHNMVFTSSGELFIIPSTHDAAECMTDTECKRVMKQMIECRG